MPQDVPFAGSRCLCGRAALRFLRPEPVLHVHCCCRDCRQGQEWAASQGGPPATRAYASVFYFANDLAPVGPGVLALLFAVKLRSTGRTTRLVARCCHSVLLIDHPYYEGNVFCAHEDCCVLVTPRTKPMCRIFSGGWDAVRDGAMPPSLAALEETKETWARFAEVIKHPAEAAAGIRLQELLAHLPPPIDLGLAEGACLARPSAAP